MSLWEEVADIGEEFVEFLEKETGLSSAEVRRCPPSKRSQYAPEPTQLCGLSADVPAAGRRDAYGMPPGLIC